MSHFRYFAIAKEESKKSNHWGYCHGAVLVKNGKIISRGFNQLKTDPKSPHPFKQLHAEIHAILRCQSDVSGSTLYVFREKDDGTFAQSKPCRVCQDLIVKSGIKTVIYSTNCGYEIQKVVG